MKTPLLALCALAVSGCASSASRNDAARSFFPLPEVEGRVEQLDENIIQLPPFPVPRGVPAVWISIVATAPAHLDGVTVRFRFKSAGDRDYRLLAANRGRLVRVSAKDGRGVLSRDAIVFYSERKRQIVLLDEPDRASALKIEERE